MLINDIDIKTYKAQCMDVIFGHAEITTYENWTRGSNAPREFGQTDKYASAEISFIVKGDTLSEAEKNVSNLLKQISSCKIAFDNYDFLFEGYLASQQKTPLIGKKAIKIVVTLTGRKLTTVQTVDLGTDKYIKITPLGNCAIDTTIEIIPTKTLSVIALTVNGTNHILKHLEPNLKYYIDGRRGKVYYYDSSGSYVNKISDYEAFDFPELIGGKENVITEILYPSTGAASTKIYYQGRWI